MSHELDTTLIFTIGRMNPPTTGHMGLVKKMIERANEVEEKEGNKAQVAVILSHTHEKDVAKNPLKCKDYKRELVREMIDKLQQKINKDKKVNVDVLCMDDEKVPNMYSSIGALVRKYQPKKMILCIGKDRDENYSGITKYYKDVEIEVVDRPEGAMSATEMRGYVTSNDMKTFVEKMEQTGLDKERIEELYGKLHEVLLQKSVSVSASAKEVKTRKRKADTQSGGKHKRAKTNKKRNTKTKKHKKRTLHRRR